MPRSVVAPLETNRGRNPLDAVHGLWIMAGVNGQNPTLSEYIAQVGVEKFARRFGWTHRRVRAWRYRERAPRKEEAEVIVRKTPVTYEGIYGARARGKPA